MASAYGTWTESTARPDATLRFLRDCRGLGILDHVRMGVGRRFGGLVGIGRLGTVQEPHAIADHLRDPAARSVLSLVGTNVQTPLHGNQTTARAVLSNLFRQFAPGHAVDKVG